MAYLHIGSTNFLLTMKYYVVWKGHDKGVFDNWSQCSNSIKGYRGALYKSFKTLAEAEYAFYSDPAIYIGKTTEESERLKKEDLSIAFGDPVPSSICTRGLYDHKTNTMDYWGVDTYSGEVVFEKKKIKGGNRSLSRLLPVVHGLAHLKNHSIEAPIYTRNKQVYYYIHNQWYESLFYKLDKGSEADKLLQRAVLWLSNHDVKGSVLLWEDLYWGNMPG